MQYCHFAHSFRLQWFYDGIQEVVDRTGIDGLRREHSNGGAFFDQRQHDAGRFGRKLHNVRHGQTVHVEQQNTTVQLGLHAGSEHCEHYSDCGVQIDDRRLRGVPALCGRKTESEKKKGVEFCFGAGCSM